MWLFSNFQYGFRSSRLTADLLTVVPDRITRGFNKFWSTWAVVLDISKAFDRIWHAGLLHKLGIMEFQVSYLTLFFLFSVIGSFGWFWMENYHKNIQLMLEFLKCPLLALQFSYYTLMTLLIVKLLTITHELYTKMFLDQKFQVSSCMSNLKQMNFLYGFVRSSSSVFFIIQVQDKYFCSVKIAKR